MRLVWGKRNPNHITSGKEDRNSLSAAAGHTLSLSLSSILIFVSV
jgi:hypothetical protein